MTTLHETTTPRPAFWLRAIEHRKHELTRQYRRTLGDTARAGISDEDFATTTATLEKMARNLGWDESPRHERHFGPGRFGRRGRHPGGLRGFGPRHPFAGEAPTETPEG